jgi:hypothetical protein
MLKKIGATGIALALVMTCWPLDRVVASTREEASEAAKRAVRCAQPGSEDCVRKCEAIDAYCAHRAVHPYSPSSGVGDLFYCESGRGTWGCRYRYTNGDVCNKEMPHAKWKCRYVTPQIEPDHGHP